MKAISLKQPWATLVILGAKVYETRSWRTSHRGPLAIHAGTTLADDMKRLCSQEPYCSVLRAAGYRAAIDLPRGAVLGTVTVVDVYATEDLEPESLPANELAFGDFRPGRFAWKLANPAPLTTPIAFGGRRNLFEIPDNIFELETQ